MTGPWGIRVLYDGDCPLCSREIRFLEKLDRGRGRIQFEDIAEPSFDPGAYGLDAGAVMARIHGVLQDGTVIGGVEVFRRAYAAVGMGWLLAWTRWPGLRRLADLAYRTFARNRLRWTGRCPVRLPTALLGLLATLAACQTAQPPLDVVADVDLDRYLGRWYEIASFPQRFQTGCVATTADYSPRDDGRIRVVNECRDGSFEGNLRRVDGVAWVTDPQRSQAKLKVQFFWPFRGDYWIIALDPEYRYAVVGHPSRDYLWILSRTPTMDPAIYATLLAGIEAQGFDLERLTPTPQPVRKNPQRQEM
jgi:apolipoprotein D and lipocalin family protein